MTDTELTLTVIFDRQCNLTKRANRGRMHSDCSIPIVWQGSNDFERAIHLYLSQPAVTYQISHDDE